MHLVDLALQVLIGLVTTAIGAGASWVGVHVQRVFRDVSAAHRKIRQLEDDIKAIKASLPGSYEPDHGKGD